MLHCIKYIALQTVVLAALLSVPITVSAHAGGLNPLGCHIDNIHGGYHCHYGSSLDLLSDNTVDAASYNKIYMAAAAVLILFLFIYVVRRFRRSARGETKPEKVEQPAQCISVSNQPAISVWRANITIWHLSIPIIAVLAAFTVDRLMHFIWAVVTLFVAIKIVEKLCHVLMVLDALLAGRRQTRAGE